MNSSSIKKNMTRTVTLSAHSARIVFPCATALAKKDVLCCPWLQATTWHWLLGDLQSRDQARECSTVVCLGKHLWTGDQTRRRFKRLCSKALYGLKQSGRFITSLGLKKSVKDPRSLSMVVSCSLASTSTMFSSLVVKRQTSTKLLVNYIKILGPVITFLGIRATETNRYYHLGQRLTIGATLIQAIQLGTRAPRINTNGFNCALRP